MTDEVNAAGDHVVRMPGVPGRPTGLSAPLCDYPGVAHKGAGRMGEAELKLKAKKCQLLQEDMLWFTSISKGDRGRPG